MSGSGERRPIPWRQAVGIPLNVLFFLLLMVIGWGDVRGFFAHPVRTGTVVLHLLMIPVMTFCTAGRDRGTEHAPDWRPFFPMLMAHSLVTAWLMPWMDARNLGVLPGGDLLRWIGFGFMVGGAALRMFSMLALGRRFASVVAVQPEHRLHTSGIYAWVRHPSYLGILLIDLGFVGVFRSAVGLLLLPVVFWMFKRRMDVEEQFLTRVFGSQYREYVARTRRLLPGVH